MTPANPTTLVGLISSIPDDQTAIIQPEQNIRISYGELKRQVQDVAEALAAAGVDRGDRVGMALPNGLANIVAFLAASMAGTAAPLEPGLQGRRVPLLPRRHQRQGAAAAARGHRRGAHGRRRPSRPDPDRRHGRQRDRRAAGRRRHASRRPRRAPDDVGARSCTPAAAPAVRSACR